MRIFGEECHDDPQSATDILRARTDELRTRMGLETMDELIKQPTGLK